MKTYTFELGREFYEILKELEGGFGTVGSFNIEIVEEKKEGPFTNTIVQINCKSDEDFFFIGFFLERVRNDRQNAHYDLHDTSETKVIIPDSFRLIADFMGCPPSALLGGFAGDASQHPFETNGSDERDIAAEYLLRTYAGADDYDDLDSLIYDLNVLRQEWPGNDPKQHAAYKKHFHKRLKELRKIYVEGKEVEP